MREAWSARTRLLHAQAAQKREPDNAAVEQRGMD
jgi:hypothetical protein